MKMITAALVLFLHPALSFAVDEATRKPPQTDPWGVLIFLCVLAVAIGFFVWKMRSSARHNRDQRR